MGFPDRKRPAMNIAIPASSSELELAIEGMTCASCVKSASKA